MIVRPAAAVLLLAASSGALADDASGCGKFKWSIARERGWFASNLNAIDSGATVALGLESYRLALSAGGVAAFPLAPERASKPNTYAGFINVAAPPAGVYQITLSDEAWIAVAQNGALVKSRGFSGQTSCPGVRKSVRFDLEAAPAIVEISNAPSPEIRLAIAPAE